MQAVSSSNGGYISSYKFDDTATWNIENSGYYVNNLMINGDAEFGTTYNVGFEAVTSSGAFSGNYCFSDTRLTSWVLGTLYIPININEQYYFSAYHKSVGASGLSIIFSGLLCYDRNKTTIYPYNLGGFGQTTLTATLNTGDTSASVASTSGWTAYTDPDYFRYFNIYPIGDANYGDPWKYTQLLYGYTTASANKVIFTSPYNGATMPAGTPVSNGRAGGSATYCLTAYTTIPATWTKYSVVMSGEGNNDIHGASVFRYGTKYITWMALTNYGQTGNYKFLTDNIIFGNLTRPGQGYPYNKHMSLQTLGLTKVSDMTEIGYG